MLLRSPHVADSRRVLQEATVSPNWYVRHGFRDRDTAFALQAVLFRALENNDSVVDPNCAFAWIQPHAGDYDVQEAYLLFVDKIVDDCS